MSGAQLLRLRGFALTAGMDQRRSVPEVFRDLGADVVAEFDAETVFYGGWESPDANRITLYGPPLRNLIGLARQTRFQADGRALSCLSVRDHYKFSKIVLRGQATGGYIQFDNPTFAGSLPLCRADRGQFSGKNVIYTMSRNNEIRWIVDWLTWHHKQHGANAFVLVDNQSTAYGPEELADALAGVAGFDTGVVVSAPFPFGPRRPAAAPLQYLQLAMHNMIFEQMLPRARAVVFADVDELVYGPPGVSIYNATCASLFGAVGFSGRWMYQTADGPARHAEHRHTCPTDADCPAKYFVTPRGLARFFKLNVHGLRHIGRRRIDDPRFGYYHCRQVSTSWYYDRGAPPAPGLAPDADAAARMSDTFSTATLPDVSC